MKNKFDEQKVNVRQKIAALWTSFMLLYIYVDYFHLYMPGKLEDLLEGKVFEFAISQGFIFIALSLAMTPMLMIFLTLTLPARLSRMTNIIVGILHVPYMLFNLVGDAWPHMYLAATIEVAMLTFIVRYAWKWPLKG